MIWGKLAFAYVSLLALPTYAATSAQIRCDRLGQSVTSLTAQAQNLGYFSLSQPIVVASDSSSAADDQARAASQKKIDEFRAWLAGANQVVSSSNVSSNCSHLAEAQSLIAGAKQQLANLMSFAGPYTQAQTTISSSPAAVSNSYTVDLPCRQSGDPENGLRVCSDVIRDVTNWTDQFLAGMVKALYRGCDLSDSTTTTDPDNCQPKNTVQTCNYFAGLTDIANTSAEQTTNHLGKSCGQWITVGQRVSGSQCMISANTMGTLEQSFYQGNGIHSLDCHWSQVKNELAQGKLKLTAATGLDPAKNYETQISMIKKAKDDLFAHKNIPQVEKCTAADLEGATPAKQSACMEYTHRLVLEQHVAHLAAIEVMNRARRSFERFDAGTNSRAFFADFKAYLQQNQNTSACRGKSSDCNSSSSTYLTSCYKPLWQSFFLNRSNSVWNAEVCQ